MKKPLAAMPLVTVLAFVKINWWKTCACTVALLEFGCTNTQVRWDATRMRQDVMVYYNDQIMDNLIRAKNNLPFVHVDITSLTAQGASQITGTIGDGETTSSTTNPDVMSALSTISRVVTRPFAYSVSPQRSETLTITTAPALGSQALASPAPAASPRWPSPTPSPTQMELAKKTTIYVSAEEGPVKEVIKEETPKTPTPKPFTIYDLYEDFARCYLRNNGEARPSKEECVPGTLKQWNGEYYYIPAGKNKKNQKAYYMFCKALFTKGQGGSLEKQVETTRAELETVKSQLATPSLR